MQPDHLSRRFLLAGILICLAAAAGAYLWANQLIETLNDYRSPLSAQAPAAGPSVGQPLTRRVVWVLVDGLRADTALRAEVMPALAALRAAGASATMHSGTPSFSQPGYSVLLTGAGPDISDGPAFNVGLEAIPVFTQDNLFSAARRAGIQTAISAYYWFERLLPADSVSRSFYTPGEDREADRSVVDAALPWLADGKDGLVLIHLDQVDYAGHHEGGAASPTWNEAARRADDLIAEIAARLDLTRDTLVVLSDHGHIDAGGHGGPEASVVTEPFVLAGAGVRPGEYGDLQMTDIAPTLAVLMGTNIPASAEGRPLLAMLKLDEAQQAHVLSAWEKEQTGLYDAYASATSQAAQLGTWEAGEGSDLLGGLRAQVQGRGRVLRSAAAFGLLAAGLWLLPRLPRRDLIWMVLSSLVFLAVFHLRYAVLDGRSYSFSSVEGPDQLVIYCAVTAGLAMLAGWTALVLLGHGPHPGRTLRWTLFVLGVLALPVLVSFAWNGPWAGRGVLPEPYSYFLALLSLIQIIFAALVGLVLTGLSALIRSGSPQRDRGKNGTADKPR